MKTFRSFRKDVLRMSARQVALLMGSTHTDISKMEKRLESDHHKTTTAFFVVFMDNPNQVIASLVRTFLALNRARPLDREEISVFKEMARQYLSETEFGSWLPEFDRRLQVHLRERKDYKPDPKAVFAKKDSFQKPEKAI